MRSGPKFAKSSANGGVDASLLWLAVPFGVAGPSDMVMAATAAEIEDSLGLDGGIRRYAADTYYGGGAWPLLTAWLGWYRARTGDVPSAQRWAEWVEHCYDGGGRLPEQVGGEHRDPEAYRSWVERWGLPARTWRGRMPCTSSCGMSCRGYEPRGSRRVCMMTPDPSPILHKPAGSSPTAGGDAPRRQGGCP